MKNLLVLLALALVSSRLNADPAPDATASTNAASDATPVPASSGTGFQLVENWGNPPDLKWVPVPDITQADNRNVAKIVVTTEQGSMFALPLEVSQFAGHMVEIKTRVKADLTSTPPGPGNGVKIMLRIRDASNNQSFPGFRLPGTSFDWQDVDWKIRVPEGAAYLEFDMGLEKVTGTVLFDAIHISTAD